jgi:hypothetical protein
METYTKINEFEIEVTEVPTPETIKTKYERSFIENQIITITEDRDSYVAKRNIEIAECEKILSEMTKLNIVTKVETMQPIIETMQKEIIN